MHDARKMGVANGIFVTAGSSSWFGSDYECNGMCWYVGGSERRLLRDSQLQIVV